MNKISQKNIFEEKNNGIFVHLKVIPNSKINSFSFENDVLKLKITAQPIENRANKAVIEFFSKQLKIAKSYIEITKGHTGREKTVFIKNLELEKFKKVFSL